MTVNSGSSTMIIAALATAAYFYPFICRPKRRLVAITIRHESRDKTAAASAAKEAQPREGENRHPRDGFARKYPPACGDNRSGYQQ
jgi:hypothetical protein